MRNIIVQPIKYTLCLFVLFISLVSCDDGNLQIQQSYDFQLETMPVPKSIVKGEAIEIRCRLIVAGNYDDAHYTIRYFQPDGKGELRLDDGTMFLPNDCYPLTKRDFKLYYTSNCTDQQAIDIYIEDDFGRVEIQTFSFNNEEIQ